MTLLGKILVFLTLALSFVMLAWALALYTNRIETKFLPAGGVIWNPDEDTHLLLVFPQPKLSRRLATAPGVRPRRGRWSSNGRRSGSAATSPSTTSTSS